MKIILLLYSIKNSFIKVKIKLWHGFLAIFFQQKVFMKLNENSFSEDDVFSASLNRLAAFS